MPQLMSDDDDPEKQRIIEACLKGGVEDIKKAVAGQLDEYVKDGMTPMHIVAMSGREDTEEIIDNLIKNGSEVDSTTQFERDTVLHLLIRHTPLRITFPTCLTLLRHNPDLDIRNRNLRTPYDLAIAKGYFDLANILDGSKTPPQAEKYYTTTVVTMHGKKLVEAVLRDDEDGARESISNGADCNFINEHGAGAIHYLFTNHYNHPPLNILPMMVNANADVNLRDYEGDTALNLLIKCSKLRPNGEMYKIVAKMLEWGADPTLKDLDGNDSIALATKFDYKDITKILRKQKTTNLTPPDSPVLESDQRKHESDQRKHESDQRKHESKSRKRTHEPVPDTTDKPINEGEDKPSKRIIVRKPKPKPPTPQEEPVENPNDTENIEDEEAISSAVDEGDDVLLEEILADPDVDLNKPNLRGLFPIHLAVMRDDPEERNRFIKRLIRRGADVNSRAIPHRSHKESGNTALHMATARDQMSTVKLLLTFNPTYSVPNDEGQIPYNLAEVNGNVQMMKVLENYKREYLNKRVKDLNSSTCTIL